jgi:hypothetical protein
MSNKFAAALRPKAPVEPVTMQIVPAPSPAPVVTTVTALPDDRRPRRGTKHIGAYFDPAVSKQLRQIALMEDTTVQDLLGEAIDLLFQARQKPMIASRAKAE